MIKGLPHSLGKYAAKPGDGGVEPGTTAKTKKYPAKPGDGGVEPKSPATAKVNK